MSRADYLSRADVEGRLLIKGGCRGQFTYQGRLWRADYLSRVDIEGGLLNEGGSFGLRKGRLSFHIYGKSIILCCRL
jgi:hypothetical protein